MPIELTRKKIVQGFINTREQQIQSGVSLEEKVVLESEIEQFKAELQAINEAEIAQEQAAAQQVRIEEATAQAAYFLDNLVIEGMTMRELCAGEAEYQVLKISVQNKIINMAEESSRLLAESQSEDAARQNELKKQIEIFKTKAEEESREAAEDHETIRLLRVDLAQSQLERNDFESKLKNATAEIDRLNDQVDDLRKEIAVGARNAYKVTDVEQQTQQLKQLTDQIKASRIHVYDVEPDSTINPRNYTAKRVDNGEAVTYNWTQAKNYIEVKDAAEVERFRQQFANQEAVSDSSLGNETPVDVTPEVPFPELPSAIPPEVPNIPAISPVVEGQQSVEVPGETIEERLAALEAQVFGYVKMAS